MKIINPQRYQGYIKEAESAAFSGWDFSWLEKRMIQAEPPWNYPSLVRALFAEADSLLDMGTGGGELLASLAPLPAESHATESYPPNQSIAKTRLSPLNVQVHAIGEGDPLPFNDASFDLVINRHDGYDPLEVYRVLKPGGNFITQQVGGLDNLALNQILDEGFSFPFFHWSLVEALTGLYEAGFVIVRAENAPLTTIFKDIGAVVYYLKAIPWQVPEFSLETHYERLVKLHNFIEHQGQFVSTAHRFLIVAKKEE